MKKKDIIIALIVLILDQFIKFIIVNKLVLNKSIKVINKLFYLTYVKNNGAAFSIFNNQRIPLIILSLFATYLIYKIIKDNDFWFKGLIFGGIFGNLVDRIIRGHVVDFLDFRIFNYNFPIFNVGDICITIGIFLLIIKLVKEDKNGSIRRN